MCVDLSQPDEATFRILVRWGARGGREEEAVVEVNQEWVCAKHISIAKETFLAKLNQLPRNLSLGLFGHSDSF